MSAVDRIGLTIVGVFVLLWGWTNHGWLSAVACFVGGWVGLGGVARAVLRVDK